MPIITPDFSEAQESTPVPAGVYLARITDVQQKTAKTSGKPYLDWKLTIFGAEGDLASQNNRPVFMNTMTSGPGAFRLKDLAKAALGAVPTEIDTDEFLGKEVEITVVERLSQDGSVSAFPDVKAVRATR